MKISLTAKPVGANIYSAQSALIYSVDVHPHGGGRGAGLEPAFFSALFEQLPTLQSRIGELPRSWIQDRASLAHLFMLSAVELQNTLGCEIERGEVRPTSSAGIYDVIFGYENSSTGSAAGSVAEALIQHLLPEGESSKEDARPTFDFATALERFTQRHQSRVLSLEHRSLERVRHRQNQKGDSQGSQKVIQAMSWVKGGQPWMTRPYSEDLRERVVRVVESGTSRNAAAKQFDVSISFVVKLMQRWKQRGTIKADKYGGWKKSNLAPHGDRIRALVMENCDITIDELCVLLAAEGIEAKRSTLGDFLLAQGLSRKKRQPTPPSRSALTSRRREPLGATSNLG